MGKPLAMQRLSNPLPIWLDARGALLDAGKIFIGESGDDPEVAPIAVYWDAEGENLAEQPLRTLSGVIVNGASPAQIYIGETDYSIRVRDADDVQITYEPSAVYSGTSGGEGPSYQPLSTNLTAISAFAPSTIGGQILSAANAAAVKTILSITAGLPLTGGTVSGNIVRNGGGSHLYHNDPNLTSGRVFVTSSGASDPTSLPGDIWIKTE